MAATCCAGAATAGARRTLARRLLSRPASDCADSNHPAYPPLPGPLPRLQVRGGAAAVQRGADGGGLHGHPGVAGLLGRGRQAGARHGCAWWGGRGGRAPGLARCVPACLPACNASMPRAHSRTAQGPSFTTLLPTPTPFCPAIGCCSGLGVQRRGHPHELCAGQRLGSSRPRRGSRVCAPHGEGPPPAGAGSGRGAVCFAPLGGQPPAAAARRCSWLAAGGPTPLHVNPPALHGPLSSPRSGAWTSAS